MGRKKKKSTSISSNAKKGAKRKSSSKPISNIDIDFIMIIFLVVIGILSFLIIYGECGTVGEILSPILSGVLGWVKYLIPFGILGIDYAVYKEDGKYLKTKLLQGIMFFGCIAAVATIYQISINNIDKTKGFDTVVQARLYFAVCAIRAEEQLVLLFGYPLVKMFSEFGATVVALGLACILLVFTFGINITEKLIDLKERMEDSREAKEEAKIERNELREARKAR